MLKHFLYETSLVSLSFKPRPKTGRRRWIPAFTGMTEMIGIVPFVMPAKAGIQ
jgi:hypothetical protein